MDRFNEWHVSAYVTPSKVSFISGARLAQERVCLWGVRVSVCACMFVGCVCVGVYLWGCV